MLIRPLLDFGIDLAPWKPFYSMESQKLEHKTLRHPHLNAAKEAWARYRYILGINSLQTRRKILAAKLHARLTQKLLEVKMDPLKLGLLQLEIHTLTSLYTAEELSDPTGPELREAIKKESKRTGRRKVCTDPEFQRSYLELPTNYMRAVLRWFFGTFPRKKTKACMLANLGGEDGYKALDISMKFLLNIPTWDGIQRRRVMEILDELAYASGESLKISPSSKTVDRNTSDTHE